MEIADKNGIGCVALSNTTHWMRPGYYGSNAAQKGFCFVALTNTIPLMPLWGSSQKKSARKFTKRNTRIKKHLGWNSFTLAKNPAIIIYSGII